MFVRYFYDLIQSNRNKIVQPKPLVLSHKGTLKNKGAKTKNQAPIVVLNPASNRVRRQNFSTHKELNFMRLASEYEDYTQTEWNIATGRDTGYFVRTCRLFPNYFTVRIRNIKET